MGSMQRSSHGYTLIFIICYAVIIFIFTLIVELLSTLEPNLDLQLVGISVLCTDYTAVEYGLNWWYAGNPAPRKYSTFLFHITREPAARREKNLEGNRIFFYPIIFLEIPSHFFTCAILYGATQALRLNRHRALLSDTDTHIHVYNMCTSIGIGRTREKIYCPGQIEKNPRNSTMTYTLRAVFF